MAPVYWSPKTLATRYQLLVTPKNLQKVENHFLGAEARSDFVLDVKSINLLVLSNQSQNS